MTQSRHCQRWFDEIPRLLAHQLLYRHHPISSELSRDYVGILKGGSYISSVSRSISGCTRATWSLQQITLPRALSRSSMRCILTSSGRLSLKCWSSWSVVDVGTSNPFRLPAVSRPTILVPAIVAWHMGITSCNSASKTLATDSQLTAMERAVGAYL